MSTSMHLQFTFSVIHEKDSEDFIGICREYSLLSFISDTAEKAMQGIMLLVLIEMSEPNEPEKV